MKYTLDYEKYAELARRVAAEGSVLLRNEDGVLPLQKGQRVSIFGRTQFEHYKSGAEKNHQIAEQLSEIRLGNQTGICGHAGNTACK